jgi:hypothetical protein
MICDKCKTDISAQHGSYFYICKCGARFCSGCGYGLQQCPACHQWVCIERSERMVQ